MAEHTNRRAHLALTDDHWKMIRSRQMTWRMDAQQHVRLHDPSTGKSATALTLRLAFDQVLGR